MNKNTNNRIHEMVDETLTKSYTGRLGNEFGDYQHSKDNSFWDKLKELGFKHRLTAREYDGNWNFNMRFYTISKELLTSDVMQKLQQYLNFYNFVIIKKEEYENSYNFCFEAKYGTEVPCGNVYYHATPTEKVDKIMRVGLTPRDEGKRGEWRTPRIYLSPWYDDGLFSSLYAEPGSFYSDKDYTVLKIDLSNMNPKPRMYRDEFASEQNCVYTYDNIPPNCLSIPPQKKKLEKEEINRVMQLVKDNIASKYGLEVNQTVLSGVIDIPQKGYSTEIEIRFELAPYVVRYRGDWQVSGWKKRFIMTPKGKKYTNTYSFGKGYASPYCKVYLEVKPIENAIKDLNKWISNEFKITAPKTTATQTESLRRMHISEATDEVENVYMRFRNDQSFRYLLVHELVKRGYVIHGTDSEFDQFDINKVKGGLRGKYGCGAYFTDAAYKCEEYGNNFVFCDINGFNILDLDDNVDAKSNPFVTKQATSNIVRMAIEYLQKNSNSTYLQLNYYLSNHAKGWEDASQDVSEMYLSLGYDGFKCGSEFVLFNFGKLNQNIVKDKADLLYDIYKQIRNTNESVIREMKQTEEFVRECIREALVEMIDEVRYIDTRYEKYNGKVQKNHWTDEYNGQEPIKNGEKIRVFHGCELQTACQIAIEGTSGKTYHPRQYSYESGMNPLGIFVTTDFEVAKKFGVSNTGMCIIEFTADTNDLEAPVWNGQGTYFGQGTNPMPFKNAEERNAQKMQYRKDAQNLEDDDYYVGGKKHDLSMGHIRNSDKPELANSIFRNNEHQALFMGDLNPNMIKRIWINLPGDNGYVHTSNAYRPMSVKAFLKEFGDKEWVDYDYGRNRKYKIKKTRLFDPAENVSSFDDLIDRLYQKEKNYFKTRDEAAQCLKDQGMLQTPPTDYAYETIKYELWPRQVIQLYGKEYFDKNFNRLGQ